MAAQEASLETGGGAQPPTSSLSAVVFEKPSIEKARQLGLDSQPHRILDAAQPTGYRLARPGETFDPATGKPAEPYSWWHTKFSDFDEFGVGISLYYRQLIFLAIIFLIAGLMSIPSILHNASFNPSDTPNILRGSAYGASRSDLSFGLNGMVDFVVCLFLILFAIVSKKVEDLAAETIDESQQTAQDYAIVVHNPPRENKDPDAYKKFFAKWGDVVTVTVALDNGDLLQLLCQKREMEVTLMTTVEGRSWMEAAADGRDMELPNRGDVGMVKRLLHKAGIYSHVTLIIEDYEDLKRRIRDLSQKDFRARRVYVIFNVEEDKRKCLDELKLGFVQRIGADLGFYIPNDEQKFEGVTLQVTEPVEPSEVLWHNFYVTQLQRGSRYLLSTALCAISLVVSYYLLYSARDSAGLVSAAIVSGINAGLPIFIKTVVASLEIHLDQSDVQDSILLKLVVARCLNTAVLKYVVTAYVSTFSRVTLSSVVSILIADMVTTPVLSVLNPYRRFAQRCLAPRAKSQEEMDLYFQGQDWNLAERYTDLIKTIFLSLFWSSVLPISLFIASAAMFIVYSADKYNILRQWKRPPALDGTLATRSRNFLTISVCSHVIMARIFFANWPYRRLVEKARCGFLVCFEGRRSHWTHHQHALVAFFTIFGWAVMGVVVWVYFFGFLQEVFQTCFGSVETVGDASNIRYRDLEGVETYVPVVNSNLFPHPFLAADVSAVPVKLLPVRHIDDQGPTPPRPNEPCSPTTDQRRSLSLCSKRDLPFLNDDASRQRLFGPIRFYQPPVNENEFGMAIHVGSAAGTMPTTTSDAVSSDPVMPFSSVSPSLVPLPVPGLQGAVNVATNILAPGQVRSSATVYPANEAALPYGWQQVVAADGRAYYHHQATGTTTWERPVAGGAAEVPVPNPNPTMAWSR